MNSFEPIESLKVERHDRREFLRIARLARLEDLNTVAIAEIVEPMRALIVDMGRFIDHWRRADAINRRRRRREHDDAGVNLRQPEDGCGGKIE